MDKEAGYKGKLFLVVGPSGSGKGSVINEIKKTYPGFVYPVSYTTREPREGEKDGQVYHYISKDKFKEMIENDEFLEYAIVHSNNYYGTSKAHILDPLIRGAVVIRELDIQGLHAISKIVPPENLVSIFMKVSDLDDLKQRILRRGEMTDDELQRRMDSALKEISQADDCSYQVENKWGEMEAAIKSVEKIILQEIQDLY